VVATKVETEEAGHWGGGSAREIQQDCPYVVRAGNSSPVRLSAPQRGQSRRLRANASQLMDAPLGPSSVSCSSCRMARPPSATSLESSSLRELQAVLRYSGSGG
jgi:hypothetical protein